MGCVRFSQHDNFKLFDDIYLAVKRLFRSSHDFVDITFDDLPLQRFFAMEVFVDRHFGYTSFGCDLIHADLIYPIVLEQLQGILQDPLADSMSSFFVTVHRR